MFDSLVRYYPKHAPGWIAATCLEEHAGRMVAAKKIIKQGCEQCPKSEDVWLEAARLHVRILVPFILFLFPLTVDLRTITMRKWCWRILSSTLGRVPRFGSQLLI